ncbi:xanthine dehydrogenase/oxidase-like [Ylistrum balloti]|uniref:xanthine dehydrogenase/oxidase-like n=1 Tax=Ylistrum balloti TaxID=509963 RepID=UPI002905AFF0|nr:xanthine dehydrogenase/oxidase-like [Ylistrum balloti]
MEKTRDTLVFYVNQQKIVENRPDPTTTLLQYLRRHLKLTGTKNACNQGGCGSCTVMLSWWDKAEQQIKHSNVNACLVLVCHLHGYAVTTVEGVGSTRKGLSGIQTSLMESFGLQCGFCTPGMVMTMHSLLQQTAEPSQESLEMALEGNICRCTGYRPIVDAFQNFCKKGCEKRGQCDKGDIEDLCQLTINGSGKHENIDDDKLEGKIRFPKELKDQGTEKLVFRSGDWSWLRPVTIQEVLSLMDKEPNSHIVMGGTNLVGKLKSNTITKGTLISCKNVQEMTIFKHNEDGIEMGAALTLTNVAERLKACNLSLNGGGIRGHVVTAMLESLRWLACQQIRNQATLGGHVMISDPRSDLCVVLVAAGARAVVISKSGHREVELNNQFFTSNGKTSLAPTEVLVSVKVPFNPVNTHVAYYKQASRKGFSYALLNGCFSASLDGRGSFRNLDLCFGTVFETTRKLTKCPSIANGNYPDDSTLGLVCDELKRELQAESNGTVSSYKQNLACGFVIKFWREIQNKLNHNKRADANGLTWKPCEGQQVFQAPSPGQPAHDAVGRSIPLVSAPALVTGQAMFLDDMPRFENELYVQPVFSTRAHARILSIDKSVAMASPGVVDFLDASTVPGENKWGLFAQDEPLFAENEVFCVGQVVCAIVATSEHYAKTAADLVKIMYLDLPNITTMEEAIAADSYFDYTSHPIDCGDPDKQFPLCDFVKEGQVRSGFQEHFYLEPSGAVVVPKNELGEIEIFTTSQAPTFCQTSASQILGIPRNRIVVRQKRLGGGFGGREYRTPLMFGAAAVAAQRLGKPVRMIMDRKTDFQTTGKRHPFLSKYKAGFRYDGTLEAVSIHFYINAGYTLDVSAAIMDNACFNVDAAYKTPVFSVYGHVCKTNTPSNTSMRAFGAAEAVFVMEAIMCTVADTVGLDQEYVRQLNMYKEGSINHYKRKLENCMLQRCWRDCITQSKFEERSKAVSLYNSQNKFKKKGIAVMPLKFGVGYPVRHLNQGAALVNIYLDGSITIAHGGVEMGQGLHTKMIQVASRALEVPIENIHISETGTNTCPNTTSTAASLSSDINGAAVLDACNKINNRLRPYKQKIPTGQWTDWVNAAYMDRVSLSATGIGRPGNQHWDFEKGVGNPVHYYTFGAACTEVEIDCLTGEHQVLDTEIVIDIGNSLNPSLDVGQIEGGFVQGYGWVTMEELKFSSKGETLACGPVDYKLPGIRNIPRRMKVSILKDCPNKGTVYSSKGVGEPPLLLAISVYIAMRKAIQACRADAGLTDAFDLDIPLTAENIRMACPIEIPTGKFAS